MDVLVYILNDWRGTSHGRLMATIALIPSSAFDSESWSVYLSVSRVHMGTYEQSQNTRENRISAVFTSRRSCTSRRGGRTAADMTRSRCPLRGVVTTCSPSRSCCSDTSTSASTSTVRGWKWWRRWGDRKDDGVHPQALRGEEELAGGIHRELLLVRLCVRARFGFVHVGKHKLSIFHTFQHDTSRKDTSDGNIFSRS